MTDPVDRPLLGDGTGKYRVQIIGNSGSGKSTTAAALAALLGVPFLSLDVIHWAPDWGQVRPAEFKAKVHAFIAENSDRGWVIDGNYDNRLGKILKKETTDIIWLDPPLVLTFYRVLIRTALRLLRMVPPCSPGCDERFSDVFFSKESILWWCLSNHWRMQKKGWGKMAEMAIGTGSDEENRKMRRIGGWGKEQREWLDRVAKMSSTH